jgi:hypothetical protein
MIIVPASRSADMASISKTTAPAGTSRNGRKSRRRHALLKCPVPGPAGRFDPMADLGRTMPFDSCPSTGARGPRDRRGGGRPDRGAGLTMTTSDEVGWHGPHAHALNDSVPGRGPHAGRRRAPRIDQPISRSPVAAISLPDTRIATRASRERKGSTKPVKGSASDAATGAPYFRQQA